MCTEKKVEARPPEARQDLERLQTPVRVAELRLFPEWPTMLAECVFFRICFFDRSEKRRWWVCHDGPNNLMTHATTPSTNKRVE